MYCHVLFKDPIIKNKNLDCKSLSFPDNMYHNDFYPVNNLYRIPYTLYCEHRCGFSTNQKMELFKMTERAIFWFCRFTKACSITAFEKVYNNHSIDETLGYKICYNIEVTLTPCGLMGKWPFMNVAKSRAKMLWVMPRKPKTPIKTPVFLKTSLLLVLVDK